MKIYIEGGGNKNSALAKELRQAFTEFFRRAGLENRMPQPVACGSRQRAYDFFCAASQNGESAILLVDSEASVPPNLRFKPWEYLRIGDQWIKPNNAKDSDCHLMVECMEAWLIADPDALAAYFQQGFSPSHLPASTHQLEDIPKQDLYRALELATKHTKTKGVYDKGTHSFKLLKLINPLKVIERSAWAHRFICEIKWRMKVLTDEEKIACEALV